MSKKANHDAILKQLLEQISTWDSFYGFLDKQMGAVKGTMHPVIVLDTLFTMYAFFIAMKENPEESDIVALVTKMVDILAYDSVEKMGIDLEVVGNQTAHDLAAAQAEIALRLFGEDAPKTFH